ncbi:PAS domain-containing protein [Nitratifractor sp.]|uniref:PAS domain-containing protein n=1 Tax=Nitratifractor sp. TaxID=2268144 RepID=UPI0025E2E193|nr:PAS domain-containing protein [Nitratifractor sp.]
MGQREELYRFTEGMIHCETDREGRVIYVNKRLCRHSGYEKSEFLGKRCDKILLAGTPREILDQIRLRVVEGRGWEGLLRYQRKDGRHFWAYSQASALTQKGETVGIAIIGRPASPEDVAKIELEFEIKSIQEKARK